MSPSGFSKFGRLALEAGLINLDQLRQCLAVQIAARQTGRKAPHLGQILVERGFLTVAQVQQLLRIQQLSLGQPPPLLEQQEVSLPAGQALFARGESTGLDLYILLDGAIELRRGSTCLALLDRKGMFVGELSALLRLPRLSDAVARRDSRLCRVPGGQLAAFLRHRPAIALKLAESLALHCRRMIEQLPDHPSGAEPAGSGTGFEPVASLNPPPQALKPMPPDLPPTEPPVSGDTAREPVPPSNPPAQAEKPVPPEPLPPAPPAPSAPPDLPAGASVEAAIVAELEALAAPPLTAEVLSAIEARLAPCLELCALEARRGAFTSADDAVQRELARQAREAQRIPSLEALEKTLDKLRRQLDAPPPPEPSDLVDTGLEPAAPSNPSAQAGKPAPPDDDTDEVDADHPGPAEQRFDAVAWANQDDSDGADDPADQDDPGNADDPADPDDQADQDDQDDGGDEPPDEPDDKPSDERPAPAVPALRHVASPILRQAMELGVVQAELLIRRARLTGPTLRACVALCVHEPLYRIFASHGIEGADLFGWASYRLALEELARRKNEELADIRLRRQSAEEESRSLRLAPGRIAAAQSVAVELVEDERTRQTLLTVIAREQRAVEREMVQAFWGIYEAAALALVAGAEPAHAPYLRAFLRGGLLGCSARFIDPLAARQLLLACVAGPDEPAFGAQATHVLYADELVELAARGRVPPSPNEDLELNHANSPAWKADRAWRRLITYRIQKTVHQDVLARLQQSLADERQAVQTAQQRLGKVASKDPNAAAKRAALKDKIQQHKVESARKERLTEVMAGQLLPRLEEKLAVARKGLADSGCPVTPGELASHEAACLRQYSRLVNKLREPFLPLALRDLAGRGGEVVNDRQTVQSALAEMERRDPLVFCESMVPGAKKTHRVLLRYAPVVVIAPGPGIMGLAVCPRTDSDIGLLVLPAAFARPGLREEALRDMLSDYRFDTSKASAGVDIMTSDTLLAAYAEYRWSMRKRDREVRQKAGVFTEENDRTNWRRHYEYYMKSAADNGKQLFFRSPELYERIVGKFIDLPEGGETLKRG